MAITPRTPEQARKLLEKANEARVLQQAARRASSLRSDFEDEMIWRKLAKARGIRLPLWGKPVTPSAMRHRLKRLGISVADYLDWQGQGPIDPRTGLNRKATLKDFAMLNPDWPLRAWVGLLLESFPAATAEPAVPKVGEVLLVRWGMIRTKYGNLFPQCDRWVMGPIVNISAAAVTMRVRMINEGEAVDKASSSGCVRGCTPECNDYRGLPGNTLIGIRRQGLRWVHQIDPEGFHWRVWDDAVEMIQLPPEHAIAA
jgi:hypothetical protein